MPIRFHDKVARIYKETRKRGGQEGFSSWIPAVPGFLRLVLSTKRIGTDETRTVGRVEG